MLDGLKLVGFAVWRSRDGHGEDVSFPSRQFVANGERRTFPLLRWVEDRLAQERLAALVRTGCNGEQGRSDRATA